MSQTGRSVFIEKNVTCPACRSAVSLKFPNPKLYAAAGRDEDQRITGYSWTGGIQTDVQPHHYSVLQCTGCLWADFLEDLERPGTDKTAMKRYRKFEKLPISQRMILRKLRRLVRGAGYDAPAGAALHLAAIFCTLLGGDDKAIDHMKLGRLYLRLSWLYREIFGSSEPAGAEELPGAAAPPNTIRRMAALGEKIENKLETLLELLPEFQELTETRTAELKLPPQKNPFARSAEEVEEHLDYAFQALGQLEKLVIMDLGNRLIIEADKTAPAGKEAENGAAPASLEDILKDVSAQWLQVPMDETAALKLAVEEFDYSFKHEGGNFNVQQSMSLGSLLIHLCRKLGDLDRALEYSVKIYKTGFRDKQSLTNDLNQAKRDGGLTDDEIKEMNRTLAVVTNILAKTADNRKEILGLLYEKHKANVAEILKVHATSPLEARVKALLDAGFAEDFVAWLKDSLAAQVPANKKRR